MKTPMETIRFRRKSDGICYKGEEFVLVHDKAKKVTHTDSNTSTNNKRKIILGVATVAIILAVIFIIDGGTGLITTGLVEAGRWLYRNPDAIHAYINLP